MTHVVPELHTSMYSKLGEFLATEELVDISIRCEERIFRCHRIVLASVSKYFHVLFSGDFKEKKNEIITLQNIDDTTFESILQFIYTGKATIQDDNIFLLLVASDFLNLSVLEDMCIQYMFEHPFVTHVLDAFVFAHATERIPLANTLRQYVVEQFDNVCQTSTFLRISVNDVYLILQQYAFKSNSENRNESVVMDAIIRWVRHSFRKRAKYFKSLKVLVDCNQISTICTNSVVDLENDIEDLDLNKNANNDALPVDLFHVNNSNVNASEEGSAIHVYFQYTSNGPHNALEVTNVFSTNQLANNWIFPCLIDYTVDIMRNIGVDRFLYCLDYCCEYNKQAFFRSSSINLVSEARALAPPPMILQDFRICEVRNNIYAYNAGCFAKVIMSRFPYTIFSFEELCRGMFFYNRELNTWFPVPQMRTTLALSTMTAENNVLYLIGGHGADGVIPPGHVQAYDQRMREWQVLARSGNSYVQAISCSHKGKIYVSTWAKSNRLEVYDPVAGRWRTIHWDSRVCVNYELLSFRNKLWAIGYGPYNTLSADTYDAERGEWSHFQDIPPARNNDYGFYRDVFVFNSLLE